MTDDRLVYPFDPSPAWIQAEHEAGSLSAERRDILLALVHRANVQRLRRGEPTPELRVESLAAATHRPTSRSGLDALRRLLRDMRRDGDLAYTTRGTGRRVVYEFTLTRTRSGVVPASQDLPVPPSARAEAGCSASDIAVANDPDRSGIPSRADAVTVPPKLVAVPPSDTRATRLPEPDPGETLRAPVPPSSDVQENASTATTKELASARACEDESEDEEELDRLWEETKPQRGYAREPNG
jgi:hypothetical protein